MTIEKGEPWGREVPRPSGLRVVADDAALGRALTDGTGTPTAVAAGDLFRTLGGRPVAERDAVHELPLDVVEVVLDDGIVRPAVAHVVARSPWWAGSWWRGPVLVVMNAQFLGEWDVAPAGHPNDGRAETQFAASEFGIRDRWNARRRLPHAAHVPHPAIATRSVRSGTWSFERPLAVYVDGRRAGSSRSVTVEVRADAATLYS